MATAYFKSRTAARAFVKSDGGKFKDNGKDAAAGERWTVIVEDAVTAESEVVEAVVTTAPEVTVEEVTDEPVVYKSKRAHARAVIAEMAGEKSRAIKDRLMSEVGLSSNGANTYYYSLK